MKIKSFLLCSLLIFGFLPPYNFAQSEYQEVYTSQGKVIIGLGEEEAMEKFGPPVSAAEEFWYYASPERFFIYFPADTILSVHLYPESCDVSVGFPLEFKVLAYLSNFKIKDITSQAQLTINEPEKFVFEKPGVIIPQETGEYQVLTKYKDIFSNPSYVSVKAQKKTPEAEQLLNINILPYKPKVSAGRESKIDFTALGTFFQPDKHMYIVREIDDQVMWFTERDGLITNERDNGIYFPSVGKVKVFAKFQDLESYPQEVEVEEMHAWRKEELKHITLLPEFIIAPRGNTINLRVFGTYHNNAVKDVSSMAHWNIGDEEVLALQGNGQFLAKSQGVTEVSAELDNLQSASTKIIVTDTKEAKKGYSPGEQKGEKVYYKDLTRDIKNDVEKIRKIFIGEGRRLSLIKIIPNYLRIPLGENRQLVALGVYTNNTEENLTLIGEWISSDNRIATVSRGKVSTLSRGEIKIHVKFQGAKSIPASVIVEDSKLVSIILSPQNSQISMRDRFNLKAEGYFSDDSRKDITSLVNWEISDPRVIRIQKGMVRPLRIGESQVAAEYAGIKSLPANIKVVFTIQWLLEMILTIASFLILSTIILFSILYFIIKYKKDKLLSLYKNPREFIIGLYENTKMVLIIFGLKHKEVLAPLYYAEFVEKRYSIKNNLLLNFTVKFEEAKYSSHILQFDDSRLALDEYNNFLKVLYSNYSKFSLILRYCLTLLHRTPLSVYRISVFVNPK